MSPIIVEQVVSQPVLSINLTEHFSTTRSSLIRSQLNLSASVTKITLEKIMIQNKVFIVSVLFVLAYIHLTSAACFDYDGGNNRLCVLIESRRASIFNGWTCSDMCKFAWHQIIGQL